MLHGINLGIITSSMTFTENDTYLVGGNDKSVGVWRVADGKQVATMPVQGSVTCVAASRDGRWIAAGSYQGDVVVWDAATYKQVFGNKIESATINDVDFSPDSTRLVSADGVANTATILDIATRRKAHTLHHGSAVSVSAAKYSPRGNQIATATKGFVRVWDSNDGQLLADIDVQVQLRCSLLWREFHLFVLTEGNEIKQINVATGSTVSEWPVPTARWPCIALPQQGKFVVCSAEKAIIFWDTATRSQLGLIPHTHYISSFAFSSDDSLLAIAPIWSDVIVKDLSSIIFPSVSVCFAPCLQSIFISSAF